MKKILLFLFLISTAFAGKGQNLVPNGDFEGYSSCPTYYSQLSKALYWINPNSASPDYFNTCAIPASFVDIPDNLFGYQNAHGGSAYGGIYLFDNAIGTNPSYREYIEAPLTSTLTANTCYHFEMFLSLGDTCKFTTDDIGVYFSDTAISGITNYYPLPFTPQLNNVTGFLFDTLNWTLVAGDYNANGGEDYLIIGNFKDDFITDTILINNSWPIVYVYIDDVSLTLMPCTDIEEQNENEAIKIYPNPAKDFISISFTLKEAKNVSVEVYDLFGRSLIRPGGELRKLRHNTGEMKIDMRSFPDGVYIVEINTGEGIYRKKILKE
ncbi:MAG TPA: T9SS type A sorting domain-containing protein [Bacteroidia bacterium]|nr:T9SS type A sorting domain-containing protein [Bacteroidia bacterium]